MIDPNDRNEELTDAEEEQYFDFWINSQEFAERCCELGQTLMQGGKVGDWLKETNKEYEKFKSNNELSALMRRLQNERV